MAFGCGALSCLPFLPFFCNRFAERVGHGERVIAGAMVTEQQALSDQACVPFVESGETERQSVESIDAVRTGTGPDEPEVAVVPCLGGAELRGVFDGLVVLGKLARDEPFRECVRRVVGWAFHGGEGHKRIDDR